ncbi:MAG: capsid cement protein [Acidobacteriota bacterium]|jgi:predicted RecA/RadA family phage recombinase
MKNFAQKGNTIQVTVPAAFNTGQVLVVEITVEGVFELPKITTDVIAQGSKLYWDSR